VKDLSEITDAQAIKALALAKNSRAFRITIGLGGFDLPNDYVYVVVESDQSTIHYGIAGDGEASS
jgi:Flp pilus assembly protein CpaB